MKEVNLEVIPSFYGKPILVAVYDSQGELVMEDNQRGIRDMQGKLIQEPAIKKANICDCIDLLIRSFPREKMNLQAISRMLKIKSCLDEAKEKLILEDAECDWVVKQLKDNDVGVKIFGLDLPNVLKHLGVSME